jgi:hypothetical protein
LWDTDQRIDSTFFHINKQKPSPECYTFVSWKSSAEGVLRNFVYNQSVAPMVFEDTMHYSLIRDDQGVVTAKVYEVSLPMCHYSFSHTLSLYQSGHQIHLEASLSA